MKTKRGRPARDYTGMRRNHLTAVRFSHTSKDRPGAYWVFRCDCGDETVEHASTVINFGMPKSCHITRPYDDRDERAIQYQEILALALSLPSSLFSARQNKIISLLTRGFSQEEVAKKLKTTQPAIHTSVFGTRQKGDSEKTGGIILKARRIADKIHKARTKA